MALDFLISIGLKPLIQLSFMPRDLAADPNKTIFYSPMITSPPKHMSVWEQLVDNFTRHLIERYGTNTVTIKDGCAFVAVSDCRGGDCVRMGKISREGQMIVCLPHHLTVLIEGPGSAPDAVIK